MADFPDPLLDLSPAEDPAPATAVLAGGCFWCTEAVYLQLDGVQSVRSGYAGGTADTANYEAVCTGLTGHAEAIEITYDPSRISFGRLLKVFFSVAHDPTQKDRQGNDRGRQYRSAVFYRTEREREIAEAYIRQLDAAHLQPGPIVTTLEPLETFYEAEAYHQNFAARNPAQPYVMAAAQPKVAKLHDTYSGLVRKP